MEDPEVQSKCQGLEEAEKKTLQEAAQRIIDAHGEQESRLLHRRFHQKRVLEMEGFPYYPLEFGSIMQFLVSADSVETPEWEIIQLLKAAVRHVPTESGYSELTGVPLDNSLSICLGTGETTMYHPNDVTAVWHMELGDLELDDRLEELQRRLIPLES
ncbi:unnamed protein product [Orchesella dallaii]|uniref:Uncharacterized protein n=1 Tax=Orchesella dallaii TaxID=48710 RepID=A0ABP1QF43_9HEXA